MTYASISHLREITNFKQGDISDSDILPFIPIADRMLNKLLTTRHHLELMSGTVDGSNTFFRVKNVPIGDKNKGNITILDSCDVDTDWVASTDGVAEAVIGKMSEGASALSLGKSGSSETFTSYTKTIATPVDCTGLRLKVDVFIKDINTLTENDSLVLRIGDDVSNYYEIIYRRKDLKDGINNFDILISDMGSTASPNIEAIDYLFIKFNVPTTADVITAGDLIMDNWRVESPDTPDINDVDVYYATLDTDEQRVYGSRNVLTAVNAREGRVTVSTAPTTTTAAEGIYATYVSTVEDVDMEMVKDSACYLLAHLCSFKIAGEAPDFTNTEDAFLRRDIAGAPDEWLRMAISIMNTLLGSKKIGLRVIKTKDVLS